MNINKLFQLNNNNNNFQLNNNITSNNDINIVGLKVSLKGRLKKSARSQKIEYNYGKIKKNFLNVFTHHSNHPINTLTGV